MFDYLSGVDVERKWSYRSSPVVFLYDVEIMSETNRSNRENCSVRVRYDISRVINFSYLVSCHPSSHSSGRLLMGCELEYNISWTCFVLCLGNCIRARVGFSGFGQQNCVVFKHRISLPSCACWLHKKVDWRKRKCRTGKMKKKKSKWNEARAENQRVAIYRARLGKPNKSQAK